MIFVRAGVNKFQNVTDIEDLKEKSNLSAKCRVGIRYRGLTLDYAITSKFGLRQQLFFQFLFLKIRYGRF